MMKVIGEEGVSVGDFVDYLISQRPSLCLHIEPILELYDEDNLVDYTAMSFHKKRGYTEGFLPYLKKLESESKIEVIRVRRLKFGSPSMEGWNYIVWKVV